MRYYISDCHFFDAAVNHGLDQRGFSSTEEMNEYMIQKWNSRVNRKDEVVILGDFSVGSAQQTGEILKRLKGKLYLVQGNHDRYLSDRNMDVSRLQWVKPYAELSDNKRKVILCHYPIMCYHGQYRLDENGNPKAYMLYGHVHNTVDEQLINQYKEITKSTVISQYDGSQRHIPCNMYNCFCMLSDYVPLTLDEWIELHSSRFTVS